MDVGEVRDEDILRALATSGARVLLIGRRALIALGIPVLTADYDVWVHFDDVEKLNSAFEGIDHVPNHLPAEARKRGRYVLENGQRVDVMLARAKASTAGTSLDFDSAWSRRSSIDVGGGLVVFVPAIEDLITTKQWASRAKDIADIQMLELLRRRGRQP
jgi:hypothetical protein